MGFLGEQRRDKEAYDDVCYTDMIFNHWVMVCLHVLEIC